MKHEEVPSIFNNQVSQDVWSPISNVKETKHNFKISPIKQENSLFSKFITNENPISAEKIKEMKETSKGHNNQMSSKAVSNMCSPESHTFQPNRRITEESMDYTEKSRSEELEELGDITKEAHKNYIDQKNLYNQFRKNPFSIDMDKTDIDPFKDFIKRHKSKLQVREETEMLTKIYQE